MKPELDGYFSEARVISNLNSFPPLNFSRVLTEKLALGFLYHLHFASGDEIASIYTLQYIWEKVGT